MGKWELVRSMMYEAWIAKKIGYPDASDLPNTRVFNTTNTNPLDRKS